MLKAYSRTYLRKAQRPFWVLFCFGFFWIQISSIVFSHEKKTDLCEIGLTSSLFRNRTKLFRLNFEPGCGLGFWNKAWMAILKRGHEAEKIRIQHLLGETFLGTDRSFFPGLLAVIVNHDLPDRGAIRLPRLVAGLQYNREQDSYFDQASILLYEWVPKISQNWAGALRVGFPRSNLIFEIKIPWRYFPSNAQSEMRGASSLGLPAAYVVLPFRAGNYSDGAPTQMLLSRRQILGQRVAVSDDESVDGTRISYHRRPFAILNRETTQRLMDRDPLLALSPQGLYLADVVGPQLQTISIVSTRTESLQKEYDLQAKRGGARLREGTYSIPWEGEAQISALSFSPHGDYLMLTRQFLLPGGQRISRVENFSLPIWRSGDGALRSVSRLEKMFSMTLQAEHRSTEGQRMELRWLSAQISPRGSFLLVLVEESISGAHQEGAFTLSDRSYYYILYDWEGHPFLKLPVVFHQHGLIKAKDISAEITPDESMIHLGVGTGTSRIFKSILLVRSLISADGSEQR